jgi:hypothetical protein
MQTAPLGAAREHAACPENCMFSSLDPACTLALAGRASDFCPEVRGIDIRPGEPDLSARPSGRGALPSAGTSRGSRDEPPMLTLLYDPVFVFVRRSS